LISIPLPKWEETCRRQGEKSAETWVYPAWAPKIRTVLRVIKMDGNSKKMRDLRNKGKQAK